MNATATILHNGQQVSVEYEYYPATKGNFVTPANGEEVFVNAVNYKGVNIYPVICSECVESIKASVWDMIETERRMAA